MNRLINRHKKIISSLLLFGYISFIAITITHVHSNESNSNYRTIDVLHSNSFTANSDSQENCQICHLYSSIEVINIGINLSSVLAAENYLFIKNDSGYISNSVNVNYLRGPPSINILSI
jgi:hypothetical protein